MMYPVEKIVEALRTIGLHLPDNTTAGNLGEHIIIGCGALVGKRQYDAQSPLGSEDAEAHQKSESVAMGDASHDGEAVTPADEMTDDEMERLADQQLELAGQTQGNRRVYE